MYLSIVIHYCAIYDDVVIVISYVFCNPFRGRLNVLANVVRISLERIFSQFNPELEPDDEVNLPPYLSSPFSPSLSPSLSLFSLLSLSLSLPLSLSPSLPLSLLLSLLPSFRPSLSFDHTLFVYNRIHICMFVQYCYFSMNFICQVHATYNW